MELVIDIGNTRVKAALFINNGIHKVLRHEEAGKDLYDDVKRFKINSIIVSSVRKQNAEQISLWESVAPTIWLDHKTPLPIKNDYQTPETLGRDRIAAVVGGRFLFPQGPVLCIDAGTCITYDVLTEANVYVGGNISPGIHLRYRAMDRIYPMPCLWLQKWKSIHFLENQLMIACQLACITGMSAEIDGMVMRYEEAFPGIQTIICGGDARYFVNHVKKKIFANQNLVLLGLHKILLFNERSLT